MYHDLLLATDGSDGARRATQHAVSLANRLDATVHVLSVVEEGPHSSEKRDELRSDPEQEATEAVEAAERVATAEGVDVTTAIRSGVPQEEILDAADATGADLIVVGTVGRTGLDQLIVGSVAEEVVRHATVPVVTVRENP
ncbi:universal stress protein [Natrarchaeobius chitinivorans]|uniref:Universal stress protein n=1 Tax=Natrarchaeobius chitinivorans TaxID=1679083 RepID=A0A3N6LU95_NATCH|nr:universal stress protein [Natrarchaeobius chitinivorans]RQG93803.1 universal stress protein [Natrarchaeobius chitinivorans]